MLCALEEVQSSPGKCAENCNDGLFPLLEILSTVYCLPSLFVAQALLGGAFLGPACEPQLVCQSMLFRVDMHQRLIPKAPLIL